LEDPSIYSYDEHYDDIREKRKELEQVKKQNVREYFSKERIIYLDWNRLDRDILTI